MGLLLSTLVTCVGVLELLTFYDRIKQQVRYQPVQTSLVTLREQYIKDLEGVRDRLEAQLAELTKKDVASVSDRKHAPTLRLNSHEDIEIEYNRKVVARSRSPSPRRYLVTESKESSPSSRRHFVVSEEPQALQGVKKSKAFGCVPEYLIEEQKNSSVPRYLLKDGDAPVSLPLPDKFLICEKENDSKAQIFRKKLVSSTTDIIEIDGEFYYRRSPSPFPTLNVSPSKNSLCSEFLDQSLIEVDELSRSKSASPVFAKESNDITIYNEINNNSEKVDLILSSSPHNSTNYWNNSLLIDQSRSSKSRSPSPNFSKNRRKHLSTSNITRTKSKSESQCDELLNESQVVAKTYSNLEVSEEKGKDESEDEEDLEVQAYTEEMMNSLDGLDKSKGCMKKKFVKRKRIKSRPSSATTDHHHSKSSDNSETNKVNDDVSLKSNSSSSKIETERRKRSISENSSEKPGEPFWVNG